VCTSPGPRDRRNRTSGLIRLEDGRSVLIDASSDLRHQALAWGVERVDAVLFTHTHADHILGVEDLRCFNWTTGNSIPCYGSASTLAEIRRFFQYIFEPDPDYQGGALARLSLHEIAELTPFKAAGLEVLPFGLDHGRTRVTGFRIGELAYATDCNSIPAPSREALRGVRYLILDALRMDPPHPTHFTIPEAIRVAEEIGAERTIFVHMTHSVDFESVSRELPAGIELAVDGLTFEFS